MGWYWFTIFLLAHKPLKDMQDFLENKKGIIYRIIETALRLH
jgi:hypothetical protein